MADGVTQLLSANVQLDSALTQLEQGLRTLESSRASALEQVDLSGALNIQTITALLTAQNFSMPAGYLQEDGVNYMVSVGDSISSRQELSDMVLFDLGLEGVEPVKLSDVAEIVVTDNSDEIYAKLNGDNGVIVSFNKQSAYATAEVSDNIQARCDALEKEYDGLHFVPLMDQGDYIYIIINSILSSLGWGALFAGADPVPVPEGSAAHPDHPLLHPRQRDLRRGADVLLRRHHQYDLPVGSGGGSGYAGG